MQFIETMKQEKSHHDSYLLYLYSQVWRSYNYYVNYVLPYKWGHCGYIRVIVTLLFFVTRMQMLTRNLQLLAATILVLAAAACACWWWCGT